MSYPCRTAHDRFYIVTLYHLFIVKINSRLLAGLFHDYLSAVLGSVLVLITNGNHFDTRHRKQL